MMKQLMCSLGFALMMGSPAFALYTNSVYSESNDGMVEFRADWSEGQIHWENGGRAYGTVGEWYTEAGSSTGMVCTVLPFRLPDLGAVSDPFTDASLQLFLWNNQLTAGADLYYVRSNVSSNLLASDYFSGASDVASVLVADDFITSSSTASNYVSTGASAGSILVDELNAAYNAGAGAGYFVFLRLSYDSDYWALTDDYCDICTRNSDGSAQWPLLRIVDHVDTDGDGLPNAWEIAHGLDPEDNGQLDPDNGAAGDPDEDGLSNSAELTNGSDPQVDDTDSDGLADGAEVNTYSTDPCDSDSDDDYLSDGDEVDLYGSDPTLKDSDDDDVNDATEIYAGSLPDSAASVPANDRPTLIGLDGFDYSNGVFSAQSGGELFDYDNSVGNDLYTGHTGAMSTWFVSSGSPRINCGRLFTQNGSGLYRALNGPETGGASIALFANSSDEPQVDTEVLYAKVLITREANVDWSGLSLFEDGTEKVFFGVGNDGAGAMVFKIDESSAADASSTYIATNNATYTLVVKMEGSQADLWINPDLGASEPSSDISKVLSEDSARCNAIRLASGGLGNVCWDDLAIGTTWESLASELTDSDSDGLPDTWETLYGLNPEISTGADGADGDPDADGLTNADELGYGTSPVSDDSDGDLLTDDDELSVYATDPVDADSDDDGVSDGDEVLAYLSDPLDTDSDDDGYADGVEVDAGTSPTNPTDNPGAAGKIIIDGFVDASIYGAPVSTQSVNTGFGDNYSELNAAYGMIADGKLYLMIAGNIEANWNKLEIFIDSTDAVTTNRLNMISNDGGDNLDGLRFDEGFAPDYSLNFRRGDGMAYIDIGDLSAQTFDNYGSLFVEEGYAATTTGTVNSVALQVAYDNSNTNGVSGGDGTVAEFNHWTNCLSGLELCIDLADLGNPVGAVKVCAFVNGSGRDYLSNQVLGGLPAGSGNLGTANTVDFSILDGDQYFTIEPVSVAGPFRIAGVQLLTGNTEVALEFEGLAAGQDYVVQDCSDLAAGFADVADSGFTATNEISQTVILSVGGESVRFFQATVAE